MQAKYATRINLLQMHEQHPTNHPIPSQFIKMLNNEFILAVYDIEYQHRIVVSSKVFEALLNSVNTHYERSTHQRYIVIYK